MKAIDLESQSGKNKFIQSTLFFAVLAYSLQAAFNISVVTVAPVFWTILGFSGAYIINFKENFEEERSR